MPEAEPKANRPPSASTHLATRLFRPVDSPTRAASSLARRPRGADVPPADDAVGTRGVNHVVVEGTPSPRDSVDARVKARDSNARRAPSRGVVHVDTRAVLRAGGGDEPERPAVPAVSAERATGGDVEKLSVRLTRLGES